MKKLHLIAAVLFPCFLFSNALSAQEVPSLKDKFAFDLLEQVYASEKGDFIVSPLGVQLVLGMAANGARGETANEICQVLGYDREELKTINAQAHAMMDRLQSNTKDSKLAIANAVFVNSRAPLMDSYKNVVKDAFRAEVTNLNFSDKRGSLQRINDWCREKTYGKIPEILNSLSEDSISLLLNAVYFNGKWECIFDEYDTERLPFFLENGQFKNVLMMWQKNTFPYQETKTLRAVRLPYKNGYSMVVMLPNGRYGLRDVVSTLKTMKWTDFLKSMSCVDDIDLLLPRFKTENFIDLKGLLSNLGMSRSFDWGMADFGSLSEQKSYISSCFQKIIIEVDENGTRAVTVDLFQSENMGVGRGSIEFHADSPFLYFIIEDKSGSILFAGKYCGGVS